MRFALALALLPACAEVSDLAEPLDAASRRPVAKAMFYGDDGTVTSLGTALLQDEVVVLDRGGRLELGPGRSGAQLRIDGGDVTIVGLEDAARTLVDTTGKRGPALDLVVRSSVTVDGLTVTGGQGALGGGIRALVDRSDRLHVRNRG